ncbi:MAG: RNA methyltransferase [Muriicola sp.]|nr:RNA methyltransferase [Muriicola sp.]
MAEHKFIASLQNPLVKKVVQLQDKKRDRLKTGLFVLEGLREFEMAIKGGYIIETVLFEAKIISDTEIKALLSDASSIPEIIEISKDVYQRLAYRDKTEGILALAKTKSHQLSDLVLQTENPLILVAEAPEKPGNIGALLRTADAANLDAVLIANPKSDLYNPNIIRSSVGCVFTVNTAMASTTEIINFLRDKKIQIWAASLTGNTVYSAINFSKASAIVVGTEATGLSDEWLNQSDSEIIIPMQGAIDSMNVSVSAAILIFEAKRQRGFE